MKLQFRHQKFQADAAKAVCDVFAGQPYLPPGCMMDQGAGAFPLHQEEDTGFTGFCNQKLVPGLNDAVILEQIRKIQRANQIPPSAALEGRYNLTIEMETGVGKTYTYIKTIYELNRRYGWSKFIVVVPSVAVREGVYKSFQITQEHFAEEYGKKIRFFIYNSARLTDIDRFVSDRFIQAMIINSQAFNAGSRDARRIYMKLDGLRSRRPIDMIAKTNPILIIDEPQSVEGQRTKERLKEFCPLFTLRYSATHKSDSIYNMIYRLDAIEAYHKRLVKKIAVKGITESGGAAAKSYVYLEAVNLSRADPTATLQFDFKGADGIRRVSRRAGIGFNLYENSGGLEEYREGFVVRAIDGRDDSVEFLNGIRLSAGEVIGKAGERQLRRIQIRETILSHIERERRLFCRGIKVLSLFFIDEVAHYKQYDAYGQAYNGIFADMFEEEYKDIVNSLQPEFGEEDYIRYLSAIRAEDTHAGYFSVDKRGRMTESRLSDRKARTSDDTDAYGLIMKNKELLLDRDPKRSPVRFIFSHSALREGWDNPNVFQICTLKQSGSEIRKRQEVGRGLRLCVNQDGERMDADALGKEVHKINVLTVIASESYDSFVKGLQSEMAEEGADCLRFPDSVFDGCIMRPENARGSNIELQINREKLDSPEFKALWSGISTKSVYSVDFDTDKLIQNAISALNRRLRVSGIYFKVEAGVMEENKSGDGLQSGASLVRKSYTGCKAEEKTGPGRSVKYDLVGRLAEETGLTRKAAAAVLIGIEKPVFEQFRDNPEEFMLKAAALINEEKANSIIQHITYHALDTHFDTDIFTGRRPRGRLGVNAVKADKHLYDHMIYDSADERDFAGELEANGDVAVYVKLPDGFYISTPAGRYTPGWAVAFYEGAVKHVSFVAETKGSMQLRLVEEAKIHCAREHFKAISNESVVYDVVDSFQSLLNRAKGQKGV